MNEYDQYVGDDVEIFLDISVSDNDTRSPKKFIQTQHQIIRIPADNKAEHFPDLGHTIKIAAINSMPKKIKHELHGKNLLYPMRIRSVMGDIRKCLQKYQPYINNEKKKGLC